MTHGSFQVCYFVIIFLKKKANILARAIPQKYVTPLKNSNAKEEDPWKLHVALITPGNFTCYKL